MSAHQNNKRAWLVVLIASLFFFYEFIQMNMFDSISRPLLHDFHINAAELGRMSAFYFVANVIFLFPAGILLDRCSTRKVILTSLSICIIGIVAFACSTAVAWATLFRFLTGIGSAFCFLSVIRLASRWFPSNKMAFVTGVVVTVAMAGGMVAQTPLLLLVKAINWRHALLLDAALGVVIFILIMLFVKNYPPEKAEMHAEERGILTELGYWKSMGMAFLNFQNWLGGIYTCLMNLPIIVLGGLWGALYLIDSQHLTEAQATTVASMLFLGTIIGSPLVGWASDKIALRRQPMMFGAVLSLLLMVFATQTGDLSFYSLLILFLFMGLTTSTQIIGYPLVAESAPKSIIAMSVSVVNITTQAGIALSQPVYGYLMDHKAYVRLHHYVRHFVRTDFNWAMWLFPAGFIIAFMAAFLLRETHCIRRLEDNL